MKQQIQESCIGPGDSKVDPNNHPFGESPIPGDDQSYKTAGNALKPEGANWVAAPADVASIQSGSLTPNDKRGLLKWIRRLLFPDPPEPRKSRRESLSWLIAYFFTGGTPVGHLVRDVSLAGMYVFTEERWYLGTVVRITLTDRRQPTAERSLTLNARVVRWGDDGVGLQFLLQDGSVPNSGFVPTLNDSLEPLGHRQLEQYLERLKFGKD